MNLPNVRPLLHFRLGNSARVPVDRVSGRLQRPRSSVQALDLRQFFSLFLLVILVDGRVGFLLLTVALDPVLLLRGAAVAVVVHSRATGVRLCAQGAVRVSVCMRVLTVVVSLGRAAAAPLAVALCAHLCRSLGRRARIRARRPPVLLLVPGPVLVTRPRGAFESVRTAGEEQLALLSQLLQLHPAVAHLTQGLRVAGVHCLVRDVFLLVDIFSARVIVEDFTRAVQVVFRSISRFRYRCEAPGLVIVSLW